MSLRPFKLLYTGVWASGYTKCKDTFSRVSIKNISLIVHTDNSFRLSAGTVLSEDSNLSPFALTGKANILYEKTGDVSEIILSEITHDNATLEQETLFSISRKKCTRLPIPNGEAFFCFSSRLPPVDYSFEATAEDESEVEEPASPPFFGEEVEEMSFDEVFETLNHSSLDGTGFDADSYFNS